MEKLDENKMSRIEIRTTSKIGDFHKVFFEDLVITPRKISFKHQWLDPIKEPITWSYQSKSSEWFVHYFLFLESFIKEIQNKDFHKDKEFSSFKITIYDKGKIVFRGRLNGTFLMNHLILSRKMLLSMIPACEFKPMYLLDDIEYKLEAEEFGEEIIDEEEIINEEEIKKEIIGSLDS